MATLCLICIFYRGKFVVCYYTRGDGYPDGKGIVLLEYLQDGNLEPLKKGLEHVQSIPFEKLLKFQKKLCKLECERPETSRIATCRCGPCDYCRRWTPVDEYLGGEILDAIGSATAEEPITIPFFPRLANDSVFCEWAYVIDLDARVFEAFGGGLPKSYGLGQRFDSIGKDTSFVPTLLKSFPIDDLPTAKVFVESVNAVAEEMDKKYGYVENPETIDW